ncbi:hypothetical protein EX227_13775 [Providencia rettgeri]|uniref:Uncharacterized protein n=1 Tax=Providencia rettgeri TaxID=587 RepID=A0A264VRL6_PRORE|nr:MULTISPECIES: hypothetical protein [Providencia]ELR5252381.1 hypothetical protein [Providencia rettgeri]MBX6949135.1 hypothetical protein [Providencia rettgeri]MBX6956250.1 hypothetical protein [Providencia rettgeri]MBX6958410.1 hypothetical protein [Providencia rettgeri]MBX7006470.1 hypothetical protein [Providencia rettgeri]
MFNFSHQLEGLSPVFNTVFAKRNVIVLTDAKRTIISTFMVAAMPTTISAIEGIGTAGSIKTFQLTTTAATNTGFKRRSFNDIHKSP